MKKSLSLASIHLFIGSPYARVALLVLVLKSGKLYDVHSNLLFAGHLVSFPKAYSIMILHASLTAII
jgi:hypothetical protein